MRNRSHMGHLHIWQHAMSRREFLGATAGAASVMATSGLWMPTLAIADDIATVPPRPIPGGITVPISPPVFIHHFPISITTNPFSTNDPSQITDFDGFVTDCRVRGGGTGTDTSTGVASRLLFQVDNGFMDGTYVGVDGQQHEGTFGFI
jgi:hypothetical protein